MKEKRNAFQGGHGKLVTKGIKFFYEEEGNLTKKVAPNGDTWTYLYFGNGMLEKVIKPDQSSVNFKYDPLGRRIEKSVIKASNGYASKLNKKKQSIEESSWEKVGGVRIRKPNTETKKPHVVQGSNQSIYGEENCKVKEAQGKVENIEKVIRFLWDGNTLLHEWEEDNTANRMKPKSKVDYKADFVLKLEKREEIKAREKAEKGIKPPDSLITWIFQDDFIPRAKITRNGNYSIVSDHLGTPVEAYDEEGNKVWERELDIYGRVKTGKKDIYGRTEKELGTRNFIPFRFQGQYEDEEIGLYYNRFRYYDPQLGQYTQQDPIGLEGNNPTLYGYVGDSNSWIDPFGLLGTVDFTGHSDLFPDPNNTVKITMTGSRGSDFTAAYNKSGIPSHTKGYTWHHVHDLNPATGETTMQLIKTETHVANVPHKGSVSQFEKEFGIKYDTYEAKQKAYDKGWRKKAPKRRNC